MKLTFGDLRAKAAAESKAKQAHEFESRVSRCSRAMMLSEKIPDRDLVRKYGKDALDECKRRYAESLWKPAPQRGQHVRSAD